MKPVALLGGMVASLTAMLGFWWLAPSGVDTTGGEHAILERPSVRLAFRGIAPFRALRYSPDAGASRDFEIVLRETSTMKATDQLLADLDREASFRVRGRVDSVSDDGSFRWEWKVRRSEVLRDRAEGPMALEDWRSAVKSMKGFKGWSTVDATGVVLDSGGSEVGSGATRAFLGTTLERLLSEPGIPLPAEEVGQGCIWEVRRHVLASDIETWTKERFEIAGERAGELRLVMGAEIEASEGEIDGPGWVDEILAFDAEGGGEWAVGLTGAMSVDGASWSDQTATLGIRVQGLGLGTESTAKLDFSIRPL